MQDQCDKMMMQKFGRIVDLEKLETVTVNRNVEELKEKLRLNEIVCSQDLRKWDVSIALLHWQLLYICGVLTCPNSYFSWNVCIFLMVPDHVFLHVHFVTINLHLSYVNERKEKCMKNATTCGIVPHKFLPT